MEQPNLFEQNRNNMKVLKTQKSKVLEQKKQDIREDLLKVLKKHGIHG